MQTEEKIKVKSNPIVKYYSARNSHIASGIYFELSNLLLMTRE